MWANEVDSVRAAPFAEDFAGACWRSSTTSGLFPSSSGVDAGGTESSSGEDCADEDECAESSSGEDCAGEDCAESSSGEHEGSGRDEDDFCFRRNAL